MKLHLPVRLFKSVLACFSVVSVCTLYSGGIVAAADLTLAEADSLAVDYADSSSITDLSGGTLTLAGGTELLLTNCGEGDGKTYTLLTGVSSLLDAEGNTLTLTDENKAASLYFDTTQPGTGFWAGAWLQLAPDGTMQLVLHGEEVREALTITTRQTGSNTYNYYEGVCFRDITVSSGPDDVYGGAIDGEHGGTITLSHNGSVTFSGNTASGSSSSSSHDAIRASASGGAIHGETITLSNNGSVTFSGNTASASSSFSYYAGGGAIYGGNNSSITLSNNGSVFFSGNTASGSSARGGAIFASVGFSLKINNNGETIFRGNYAHSPASHAVGGAIYSEWGIFSIQNNASVVFEKNYTLREETLRLQSICASDAKDAYEEMLVNFSAPKGGKIEFRDSILISATGISNFAAAFHLNNWYVNDAGEKVAQTGDIIFTGEDATAENLKAILAEHGIHREATAEEIRLSKTSEVIGTMQLHDGRLIVRDGAIIGADGITVHGSASGESTPTLWLNNGELTPNLYSYTRKNAVTISGGSALRLSGQNTARNSTLTLSADSTLIIDVAAAHTTTAALTLNDSTLSLGGTITLQLNAAEGLNTAGHYMLLSGVSAPTDWASNITVSGGVWTIDDLSWVNNTLYLNFPTLTEATWNNQSGDRLWNVNSSVNWEQHDIDYAYKDGIGVIFGDEGAGKVTLVGTLTPASVLVNSTGNYSFEGSGSLSGGMTLTKQGSGTLSISTANSYTGGTMIEAGTVVAKHAAALGTGMVTLAGGTLEIAVTGVGNIIANTGTSTLKVANGITHGLTGTIANSGELTLIGNFDASKLDKSESADVYVDVLGNETAAGSGFTRSGDFTVSIANGTVDSTGASVSYKGTTLEMAGGVGLSKGGMLWGEYRILSGHTASSSAIHGYDEGKGKNALITLADGGTLSADDATTETKVNAMGGSINLSAGTLSGTVGGSTIVTVSGTATMSGDNSYTGGTTVNGGKLVAGSNTAFGSGDVAVNDGGTLDLGACIIANRVLLSGDATLAHADGASNILMQSGANADFANGFELSAGKSLTVGAGMAAFARSRAARVGGTVYRGALTLGGGELTLNEHLTVEGHVNFGAGTTTIVNVAGWQGAEAGTELASFSSNSGYTEESLTLRGAAAGLVLNFDAATGVLSLVAAQQPLPPAPPVEPEFVPDLNRNQQEVYDTVKDIVAGGEKPEGELGKLVELISGSRNEAELRELLDAVGGSEYATLMSSQLDGNLAHVRNLRNRMGSGWELVGNNYMRAMIEMFGQHSEVDGDAHGRGYTRSEMGGQFTLEFIGCMHMSSGVALASGHTRLNPDDALRQSVNNNYVDFYTTYRGHGHCNMGYSAKFSLGIGTHDYNLRRNVPGTSTTADADGFSVNFMHESAYIVRLSQGSSLQVFGVVESSFSSIGGFREKGAGTASLVMESQDAWATDITLGLRYVQLLDSFALPQATLTLQAGVTAGVGDTSDSLHLHFAGAPDKRYYQTGADRNRWGYNLGVGLHVPVSNTSAFYMSGETILRGDSYEWNGNVGFQIAF